MEIRQEKSRLPSAAYVSHCSFYRSWEQTVAAVAPASFYFDHRFRVFDTHGYSTLLEGLNGSFGDNVLRESEHTLI